LVRRQGLRARSLKRQRLYTLRRRLVQRVLEEEPTCQFPACQRPSTEVHELLSRARGGSILDRANCVALCHEHHDAITTHQPGTEAWRHTRQGIGGAA
jgi:5-methylcytosine-specific restriction endonuclease McrA